MPAGAQPQAMRPVSCGDESTYPERSPSPPFAKRGLASRPPIRKTERPFAEPRSTKGRFGQSGRRAILGSETMHAAGLRDPTAPPGNLKSGWKLL